MEGPSKADIQCEDNADGTCQVKYMPTEPGNYVVNIKFADEHIRGATTSSVETVGYRSVQPWPSGWRAGVTRGPWKVFGRED